MISNVIARPVMTVYYIQRLKCAAMKVRCCNQARTAKGFERTWEKSGNDLNLNRI